MPTYIIISKYLLSIYSVLSTLYTRETLDSTNDFY